MVQRVFLTLGLWVSVFATAASAAEEADRHNVVISLTDELGEDTEETCRRIYSSLQSAGPISSSCLDIPSNESSVVLDARVRDIRASKQADLYMHVQRVSKQYTWVRVTNFRQDDDKLDFKTVVLHFRSGDFANTRSLMRLAKHVSHYLKFKERYKTQAVVDGIQASKQLKVLPDGVVVNAADNLPVTPSEAYEIMKEESETTREYLRAVLELAAITGFGLYKYRKIESNREDQDYPGSFWHNLKLKLKGQLTGTDDNSTAANIGHVGSGMLFYQVARSNNFTALESTIFTIAASAAWEYAIEYRELMSVNDMVMTGIAGAAMGEVFHKMSLAIRNKSDSLLAKTFAIILNPVGAVNDKLNDWSDKERVFPKVGDLDSRMFSKFELNLGWSRFDRGDGKTPALQMGVNGEVYEIEMFHKPGQVSRLLWDAPINKMQFRYAHSDFGAEDFKLLTRSVLAAYYHKNLGRDERGLLKGYEILIGGGASFEWDQSRSAPLYLEESTDPNRDMIANAHVVEGTVEAFGFYNGFQFRLALEISGDYAMVRSFALEEYVADNGTGGLLRVMERRGYYYGTGWTGALSVDAIYGRWKVSGRIATTSLSKSKVYHRAEDEAYNNKDAKDEQVVGELSLTYLITRSTAVRAYCSRKERNGIFGTYHSLRRTKECGSEFQYIF